MTEARLGAIVLAGLVAAAAGLLALEGRHLRPGIRIAVEMDRVGNLQAGADVKLAGLTLGTVDDIQLVQAPAEAGDPAHALLQVWIDGRHRDLVRETTDFFINQEGLLGDSYLGIAERPVEPGPPLPDGARVRGVAPPQIDKLLGQSYKNLMAATQLLRDGIPEIDVLIERLDALERTLDELPAATPLWTASVALLAEGRALSSGVAPGAVDATWAHGRELLARQQRAFGPLSAKLARVSAAAERISSRLGDPRAQRLVQAVNRIGALVERTERAVATAEALIAMVARGQGSLGAFLADVELADEMKDMMRTMKRQPWKTLGTERSGK